MALKLYGRDADYCTQKIMVAAAYNGIRVELITSATDEEIGEMAHGAAAPVLETRRGCLWQSNAILRHVAEMNPEAGLYGAREFDCALIDQWLDLSRNELEVPLAILTAAGKKESAGPARDDVFRFLAHIEAHLGGRTFLVGQAITIADVAVVCALRNAFALVLDAKARAQFPAVTRWYMTAAHHPSFLCVLGEVKLFGGLGPAVPATPIPAAAAAAAPAAAAPKGKGKGKQGGKAAAPAASAGSKARVLTVEHTTRGSFSRPISAAAAAPAAGEGVVAGPVHTVGAEGGVGASASAPPAHFNLYRRGRTRVSEVVSDASNGLVGRTLTIKGWAKTVRKQGGGKLLFVELNDGSCFASLQVVVSQSCEGFEGVAAAGGVGAAFACTGVLVASPAAGQAVEMQATKCEVLGSVDPSTYPLSKKRHTVEHLRDHAHLRVRTNIGGAVMRVRNAMAYATNKFFNDNGFNLIHTPLITASDCEGAGEMFGVTTMLPQDGKPGSIPTKKDGTIDFSKDFFSKRAYLTVSGQLNVETHCEGLSDVYTFGPTFRAENSHTTRHLAEFWMIEPEIAFGTLLDDMNLAEDYLKYCVHFALAHCAEDLAFFDKQVEKGLIERLKNVVASPFARITYTEAVEMLTQPEHMAAGKFEETPSWGMDLGSEHERYLTEQVFKKPVIVSNYPKAIKAFYMREDEDPRTVAAMDILVPKIGEIIGGSQREERLEVLEKRILDMGDKLEDHSWYLDLRRFGSVPHSGFGLGFERLVLFVTGVENIRDVIPFPRVPGRAEF